MPPDHECIQCGLLDYGAVGDGTHFWPIRNDDREAYEAICDPCAQRYVECDCCGDARHEEEIFLKRDAIPGTSQYKEWAICTECTQCGGRCDVIQGRIDREYIAAEARQRKVTREQQVSEVRESLRMTLERQARRQADQNQTTV